MGIIKFSRTNTSTRSYNATKTCENPRRGVVAPQLSAYLQIFVAPMGAREQFSRGFSERAPPLPWGDQINFAHNEIFPAGWAYDEQGFNSRDFITASNSGTRTTNLFSAKHFAPGQSDGTCVCTFGLLSGHNGWIVRKIVQLRSFDGRNEPLNAVR